MDDKISVIMGIYNCAETLGGAINSIISQTYTNWELIMCDDCSTDNTYEIAQEYKNKYPNNIILIKNKTNSKLAYSLNHCLEYATGTYVARMDADDISVPDRFEKQVTFLKNNPEIDLVGTAMQRFDGNTLADIYYPPENPDYYTLKDEIPFCHATILIRRTVFDKLNGYTVCNRTARCEDYDLWFKFYNAGFNGKNLMQPLYMVRENANAIRRRTAKTRLDALKTTWIGFNLLKYPKLWLIKPTIVCFIKMLTPYKIVDYYRAWQAKKD